MAKSRPAAKEPLFLAQYRETYPLQEQFFVTADHMVFLTEVEAIAHQANCGGEIKTY